jgi:2-methylcitrate dehydratase PrpD
MLTERLAKLVAETRSDAFSDEMLERAAAALVDTMGCAVAGAVGDVTETALRYIRTLEAAPRATLWGRDERTSAQEAAFLNGISGHTLDFDDTLPSVRGHPSVPLFAAGLALADTRTISGRQLLEAFVIGLEVFGKVGRALSDGHYMRGWHMTATAGSFSSAAMVGRLIGLDEAQMRNAFGLVASDSGGLVRNFGTMAKAFHAGRSARAGFNAARLAAEGMTADPSILDGPGGTVAAYGEDDASTDVPTPGAPWEIIDPSIFVKRWPCCYANHRALAGVFDLVKTHGIRPEAIQEIAVGFMPDADKALVHFTARTGLEGKFSIEYCAAAAVINGSITLASFTDEAVRRPAVQALMPKVRRFAMPGEGSFSGVKGMTDVVITTDRGRFETRVEHTPGSPKAPMTTEDRRDKFFGCVVPVLGAEQADALFAALSAIAGAPDVAEVMRLTVPRARRTAAA